MCPYVLYERPYALYKHLGGLSKCPRCVGSVGVVKSFIDVTSALSYSFGNAFCNETFNTFCMICFSFEVISVAYSVRLQGSPRCYYAFGDVSVRH